jgi:probable HAF family extracellular repeat protein
MHRNIMNRILTKVLSAWSSLLLLVAVPYAWGCGQNGITLIELPMPPGSIWQANALNAAGQMTGYVTPAGTDERHIFFYDGRVVTDLGTLGGGYGQGFVMNSAGQIAGQSTLSGETTTEAFLWTGDELTDLGTLGGSWSCPTAINDLSQVAGYSLAAGDGGMLGFLYANGSMTSLGTLGGQQSYAFALNKAGVAVGGADLEDGNSHAFSFSDGIIRDLGTLGGNYSSAFAVNSAGVIVGESTLLNGESHGFIYSDGVMTDVGTLGGTASSCFAINDRGEVIGYYITTGGEFRGFIWSGGVGTDLGTLGGGFSLPATINNLGQVVGAATAANGAMHAFLWQKGNLVDLNSLLPTNSGWELSSAELINDAGRIACSGSRNGDYQTLILDLGSANHPPVAAAGPDQTVDCRAQVTLNGASSTDPDGDTLNYQWSAGGYTLGTNAILVHWFALGTNVVALTVTDPCGASSQSTVVVRVVDTNPPTLILPSPTTVAARSDCQAPVPDVLSQVVASDDCTLPGALVLSQHPAAGTLLGLGQHLITVTAEDPSGNSSAGNVLLTVADTTAPVIQSVTASPNVLSPPNHKLTPVSISVAAADSCDPAPVSRIVSITANETTDPDDIQITGNLTAKLAASRNSAGGGRIYAIMVQVTDASGNCATSVVQVVVPQGSQPADGSAGTAGTKPKGKKP